MSVSGISGSGTVGIQNQFQQVHSHFKKLSEASDQTDFVSLSQAVRSQLNTASPFGLVLNKMGQALQSGDVAAAQNCLDTLRKVGACAAPKGSHVPPMAEQLSQGLDAVGQALQAGDLSAAQQAYRAVEQVWQQTVGARAGGRTLGTSSGVSVHI